MRPGGRPVPVAGARAPDPEVVAEREALLANMPEPCAEQPWTADDAPWNDSTYTAMGVIPPMVITTGEELAQAQRMSGIDPMRDLRQGERAQVIFQILVGPDGTNALMQIGATTGNAAVERAGRSIASTLRFRPATRFGCGVAGWFQFPFRMARSIGGTVARR